MASTTMVINRFEPECVLGTGTYGHVVRCNDRNSSDKVAVKIARPEPAYRRSAMNEIYILQNLKHCDKVVGYKGHFEAESRIHIVCELLDMNLYEHLKVMRFRPLPLSQVRAVAQACLEACSEIHKLGYIHCDIKPENVMLKEQPSISKQQQPHHSIGGTEMSSTETTPSDMSLQGYQDAMPTPLPKPVKTDPEILMIDFGSVRRVKENQYYDIQSLWYRAPEVLCGLPYTTAIDSWSIGCLLYELRTGTPLFPADDAHDAMERICRMVGKPSLDAQQNGKLSENLNFDVSASERPTMLDQVLSGNSTEEVEFRELVTALLQPDETRRWTAGEALGCSFLTRKVSEEQAQPAIVPPSLVPPSPVVAAVCPSPGDADALPITSTQNKPLGMTISRGSECSMSSNASHYPGGTFEMRTESSVGCPVDCGDDDDDEGNDESFENLDGSFSMATRDHNDSVTQSMREGDVCCIGIPDEGERSVSSSGTSPASRGTITPIAPLHQPSITCGERVAYL